MTTERLRGQHTLWDAYQLEFAPDYEGDVAGMLIDNVLRDLEPDATVTDALTTYFDPQGAYYSQRHALFSREIDTDSNRIYIFAVGLYVKKENLSILQAQRQLSIIGSQVTVYNTATLEYFHQMQGYQICTNAGVAQCLHPQFPTEDSLQQSIQELDER